MENIKGNFEEYLRDESRKTGSADTISFPADEGQVREIMRKLRSKGTSVTIQGARTGITAGAVPQGGHILNLERMDRVTGIRYDKNKDAFVVIVQPGLILSRLREMISAKDFNKDGWQDSSLKVLKLFESSGEWFFPPDPTETSASIGGMTACNASGARSYLYGPTRKYVEALGIILADGSALRLERGENTAEGLNFNIVTDSGRILYGRLPEYPMPDVKNAAGYFSNAGMDLVDLFIGSEGTLGVIASIELRLLRKPACIWGMTAFLPGIEGTLSYVKALRAESKKNRDFMPAAIEYFNDSALELLKNIKKTNDAFSSLPDLPAMPAHAVYTEFHGENESQVCNMAMSASEILENCGGDSDKTWLAASPAEMERMLTFRHAVPEAVNLTIDKLRKYDPGLVKLGTDMAVPDDRLEEVMCMYNAGLDEAKLYSVIFGHIGNNHVHVNILPRSMEEYSAGKALYSIWAQKVSGMGGTVSAEHGIGKLKTALLAQMYGEKSVLKMRELKSIFDPEGLLNRGNLF